MATIAMVENPVSLKMAAAGRKGGTDTGTRYRPAEYTRYRSVECTRYRPAECTSYRFYRPA